MKILIFGGTTEGGRLARALSEHGHSVTLSVVSEYAKELCSGTYEIAVKRLDADEMARYLTDHPQDIVIDTTHPYAEKATANIQDACKKTDTKCLRLIRSKTKRHDCIQYVDNVMAAVHVLNDNSDNVFLAIGSKDLESFTGLNDFSSRCHVRILPMLESLQKAIELGFRNSNIICMHGPFNEETNRAMLKATNCRFLVTKDSGQQGGFDAKISAALSCGCQVVVIERPTDETGYSFEDICAHFDIPYINAQYTTTQNPFFPLFFNIKEKRILVVGGGNVAERRIGILLRFGAKIRLISPEVKDQLRKSIDKNEIEFYHRTYRPGDVEQFKPFLVIAATNDRETNDAVSREARFNGIAAVVSDRRDCCDCYFPAIAENERLLTGIISKDGDHNNVRTTAVQIRRLLIDNQIKFRTDSNSQTSSDHDF